MFRDEFLRSLADRGLRGARLIIAEEHKGPKAAAARVPGATIQRCRTHFKDLCIIQVSVRFMPLVFFCKAIVDVLMDLFYAKRLIELGLMTPFSGLTRCWIGLRFPRS